MIARFNGAVTLSLQKLDLDLWRMHCNHGFNGAVTLSLQKFFNKFIFQFNLPLLQWGCNFIVTEIDTGLIYEDIARSLQWGCNFIVTEIGNIYGIE